MMSPGSALSAISRSCAKNRIGECTAIGLPRPDGVSFLPTLLGQGGQRAHDHLYWEFQERGGKVAVRFGDWIVRLNCVPSRRFQKAATDICQ